MSHTRRSRRKPRLPGEPQKKTKGETVTRQAILPTALYTRREAAALLGVSPSRLTRLAEEQHVRATKTTGRFRFLGQWLLDWINDSK
jgi:excisionase family DNA binding protein